MFILYFFVLLSFLYSSFSFSFQNDFESVSYLDESSHLASTRDMYNAPYSLCLKDGISVDMCYKVSILLGGKAFKEVYYVRDIAAQPETYFQNLTFFQMEHLKNNYFLLGDEKMSLNLPTLGQLEYLLDNNYVKKIIGHKYWYVKSNNVIAFTYYGARPTSTPPNVFDAKAMLTRFVDSSFPSSCEEILCTNFYDSMNWTLQIASTSIYTTRYYYGFTQNGKSYRYDLSGERNLLIPADATGVWLDIWHDGMVNYVAQIKNLENDVGYENVLCVRISGSLFIYSWRLYSSRCWI